VPAQQAAPAAAAAPRPAWRQLARAQATLLLRPSPAVLRRVALAGVLAAVAIMLTGAGVRLSQSGLGCPDWPRCTGASVFASGSSPGDSLVHRWIEFGNRLVGVAVFIVAVAVWFAAWRYRPAGRRRPDLVWLASAQPAGIAAQAGIGGIVVLTKLDPVWVSVHFVVSIAVLAAAVAFLVRCSEGTGPARLLVRAEVRLLTFGVLAAVTVMICAGTVVTGTGPLAGAANVPRYHLPLSGVTQLHADIGWLLGGLAIALALALRLTAAPAAVVRLGWLLVAAIGLQGVIGYVQYFSGLPAGLVWVHEAGATLIFIIAVRLVFATRERVPDLVAAGPSATPAAEPARPAAAGPGTALGDSVQRRN
jgi:cytochrome c oxidase assembly protein subunit 15